MLRGFVKQSTDLSYNNNYKTWDSPLQISTMLNFGNYVVEFVQNLLQLNPCNFNMERITFQVVSVKQWLLLFKMRYCIKFIYYLLYLLINNILFII